MHAVSTVKDIVTSIFSPIHLLEEHLSE